MKKHERQVMIPAARIRQGPLPKFSVYSPSGGGFIWDTSPQIRPDPFTWVDCPVPEGIPGDSHIVMSWDDALNIDINPENLPYWSGGCSWIDIPSLDINGIITSSAQRDRIQCAIITYEGHEAAPYWARDYCGYVPLPENAQIRSVAVALSHVGIGRNYHLAIKDALLYMSEGCSAETVLGEYDAIARVSPNNEAVLATLLARTGSYPSAKFADYDALNAWCKAHGAPVFLSSVIGAPSTVPPPQPAVAHPLPRGLECELSFTDTEYGTCRYTIGRSGSGTYSVDPDLLADILADHSTFEEVIDAVDEDVNENAWTYCEPDMSSDGYDYEYDRHEENDSGDGCVEWDNRNEFKRRLLQWIARNDPDWLRNNTTRGWREERGILIEDNPGAAVNEDGW